MSDNFEVIIAVHKNSRFKNYTQSIYWADNSISIFGSLVAGLLEIIIRKKINLKLSDQVYAQFSKALKLETTFSSNEYFLEAYPIIENLVELFENSSHLFSELNEWLWHYLLPGDYCINNKVVYVFKNMLLALISQEDLRYKIETKQIFTREEVQILVQQVSDYFKVGIKVVYKDVINSYIPKNYNHFLPLIVIEEKNEENYALLKANLFDQNGNSLKDYSFLYEDYRKIINRPTLSLSLKSDIEKNFEDQRPIGNSGSLNLTSEKEPIEDSESKTKRRTKSIEKLLLGFEYKSKSNIIMNIIETSTKIQIIEGTHPNVALGTSEIAKIEENKSTCDARKKQDFEMMRVVVEFFYKMDSKLSSLPAEVIQSFNQLNCKSKLVEEFPSLKQYLITEDSITCQNCKTPDNPGDFQLFSCKLKCILCFPCRRKFSDTNCQLCRRVYTEYEKDLFNTLSIGY